METIDWQDCYDVGWRGMLHPEAFAHPAKFSRALVDRIIRYGLESDWWGAGELIGDPFGGVAGGGIVCAYAGLRWVGVELEEKFVKLGQQNIDMHRARWTAAGDPIPALLQGDSRNFGEIVGQVGGIVRSPPYENSIVGRGDGIDWQKTCEVHRGSRTAGRGAIADGYRQINGVITSPPYGETLSHGGGPDTKYDILQGGKSLLAIKSGYGASSGQIGEEAGESYWQAMHQVYSQCALALKPGGVMCVVVKDYVKNRARVPLCDQTLRLLEHVGFISVCRVRAMLVKDRRHAGLFGDIHEQTSRKSFFRRLCEKNGSPPIDWEEVLVVRNGAV